MALFSCLVSGRLLGVCCLGGSLGSFLGRLCLLGLGLRLSFGSFLGRLCLLGLSLGSFLGRSLFLCGRLGFGSLLRGGCFLRRFSLGSCRCR